MFYNHEIHRIILIFYMPQVIIKHTVSLSRCYTIGVFSFTRNPCKMCMDFDVCINHNYYGNILCDQEDCSAISAGLSLVRSLPRKTVQSVHHATCCGNILCCQEDCSAISAGLSSVRSLPRNLYSLSIMPHGVVIFCAARRIVVQ